MDNDAASLQVDDQYSSTACAYNAGLLGRLRAHVDDEAVDELDPVVLVEAPAFRRKAPRFAPDSRRGTR